MGIIGFTSERKELATEVNLNNVYVNASGVIENILCGSNYDGYLWNKIFQKRIIENNNLKFLKNIVVWEDLLFVLQYLKIVVQLQFQMKNCIIIGIERVVLLIIIDWTNIYRNIK